MAEQPTVDQTVIASSNDAIVGTDSGKVRGYIRTGTYTFKGIAYAKASYHSVYGEVVSDWRLEENTMTLHVMVPPTPRLRYICAVKK